MNLKALSFGALLGFLVAVIPSCGTPACSPTNCKGCCDATNKCVPESASNSNTACGAKGATCANCTSMNQVCNAALFVCESTGQGGGGGTTGGGSGGGNVTGGGTGTGGGSVTGGGTGTGGGSVTGGGGGTSGACSVTAQNCPNAGESCMYRADGSTGCLAGPCDVVSQNCPTSTDRCNYVGLADGGVTRACVPAGTLAEGAPCTTDTCARGLVCVGGSCAKYCYQTTNCTGAGQCISSVTIPGTVEVPLTCVTLMTCDPLLQNCPTTTDGCYLTQSGPSCLPGGTAANGASCASANCVKGSICLGASQAAGVCHQFCNKDGGMPSCPSGACGGVTGSGGQVQPFGACQ